MRDHISRKDNIRNISPKTLQVYSHCGCLYFCITNTREKRNRESQTTIINVIFVKYVIFYICYMYYKVLVVLASLTGCLNNTKTHRPINNVKLDLLGTVGGNDVIEKLYGSSK